jgi:hypothetical protein
MDKDTTTERTAKVAKTETAVSAMKLGGTETIKNVAKKKM